MFPYGQNDRQVQDFSDIAVQILWNPAGVYNLNSNACPGGVSCSGRYDLHGGNKCLLEIIVEHRTQ